MRLNNDQLGVAIIIICLFAVIGFGEQAMLANKSLEHINTIINELMGIVILLVGYFWGSSKGSKDKTELLKKRNINEVTEDAEVDE